MSDQEYEKQKAIQAQHRHELEKSAQATALAAQRAAQSSEMARQEQNASLRRQEEIAETNSFRTTLLSTISLLKDNDKHDYLIQQISKRIPHFESNHLKIINKNGIYNIIGLFECLKGAIDKISKTYEWNELVEVKSKQSTLVAKLNKWTSNWTLNDILNKNVEQGSKFIKLFFLGLVAFLLLLINLGENHNFTKRDAFSAIFMMLFAWLSGLLIVKLAYPHVKSIQKLQLEIDQKSTKIKNDFFEIVKNSDYKKNLSKQSTKEFAELYFEKYVFHDIQKEQEFLPPSYQLNPDDWKSSTITNSTLLNISEKINKIDEEINNEFSFEWFTTGKISFKQ